MSLPDVYRQQGLKIGDVGVVVPDDGSFDVFFNICLPTTHSLHRQMGVPNNFTPVQLDDRDIAIFPKVECAGRIISTSSVTRRRPTKVQPGAIQVNHGRPDVTMGQYADLHNRDL